MRDHLTAMDAAVGRRKLPPWFLAPRPRMVELAGSATDGLHTYFCPVSHTAAALRCSRSGHLDRSDPVGRTGRLMADAAREYLGFCLGMPNYRNNLRRFGFTWDELDSADDRLL